eukprot:792544-Rhodomonas_salina.5
MMTADPGLSAYAPAHWHTAATTTESAGLRIGLNSAPNVCGSTTVKSRDGRSQVTRTAAPTPQARTTRLALVPDHVTSRASALLRRLCPGET